MNTETITVFLGWCTLINFLVLLFATIALVAFRDVAITIHSKLLGLDSKDLEREYFRYLANYKIVVVVFNLVPWIVFRFLL